MFWQYCAGVLITGTFSVVLLLLNRAFSKKDKKADEEDDKENRINDLETLVQSLRSALSRAERDNCRIQMLIMMMHYPHETEQIMKLAEHYFSVLHGDWYMTGIFNKWLTDNKIGKPEWFNSEG